MDFLKEDNQAAQSNIAMASQQSLWKAMYLNKSPWLKKDKIFSLNLAAAIAGEISRLVTLEIESHADNEGIDVIYQREVMRGIRNRVELGLALGGIIIKPYISSNTIKIDFAQPDEFTIVGCTSDGRITGVVFKDYHAQNGTLYARLEQHRFDENEKLYTIVNKVFTADQRGEPQKEIKNYSIIEAWAGLEPELTLANIESPLFGYFKPATSNNIDTKSPLGVSIYARAVEAIKRCDMQASGLVREFRVKEAKQYVSSLAVKSTKEPLPYLEDDFYIKLNTNSGKSGEEFFESYSPEIYAEKYIMALNEYKRQVEDCVGIAHGTISPPESVTKTATEVKSSRERMAVTISENRRNLEDALRDVSYAIGIWMNYPNVPSDYGIVTTFDEGIYIDWEVEINGMLADVSQGLLRPEIYLSKKYSVTEEEAILMMPEGERLLRGNYPPDDGGGV